MSIWAFATIPTPIFCKSTDPCSCTGASGRLHGGFEIVEAFCVEPNSTENVTRIAMAAYDSVFASVGEEVTVILASILVTFITVL